VKLDERSSRRNIENKKGDSFQNAKSKEIE